MHAHLHILAYIYIHTYTHPSIYTHMHTHMHTHIHTHMHACTHSYLHILLHTGIHTHAYIIYTELQHIEWKLNYHHLLFVLFRASFQTTWCSSLDRWSASTTPYHRRTSFLHHPDTRCPLWCGEILSRFHLGPTQWSIRWRRKNSRGDIIFSWKESFVFRLAVFRMKSLPRPCHSIMATWGGKSPALPRCMGSWWVCDFPIGKLRLSLGFVLWEHQRRSWSCRGLRMIQLDGSIWIPLSRFVAFFTVTGI